MTRTEAEWGSWAREHRACFQAAPMIEDVRGEKLQVGFSLTLYVAAPLESAPGPQRGEAVREKALLCAGNVEGVASVKDMMSVDRSAPEATHVQL